METLSSNEGGDSIYNANEYHLQTHYQQGICCDAATPPCAAQPHLFRRAACRREMGSAGGARRPRSVDGGSDDDADAQAHGGRSEEHTSELQSPCNLVCRLLLEKKKKNKVQAISDSTPLPTRQSILS